MIKRYVKKRSRETVQVQVTVTPVDTVQHCSPCPLDPEPSSSVCVESNHHRLVRVSKRSDSSAPRTRGRGIKDEPPPTAS